MADLRLYLVTSSDNLPPGTTLEATVQEAILGGVTIVQLREKKIPTRDFLDRANSLRQICRPPTKLIINDRIDIALASNADGVHLGQEDMPIGIARKILGPSAIIGISVNTVSEAVQAAKDGATYLGVGTCWTTGTKSIPNHKIIGPRGVKSIRDELCRLGHSIPLVTIGGINSDNLIRTLYGCVSDRFYDRHAESAIGIAVVSAIMSSTDPRHSAAQLRLYIEKFEAWLESTQKSEGDNLSSEDQISMTMDRFISATSPRLIHHITNTVVQNDCANLTLALGCSPLMSSNVNEVEELVTAKPGCLVFNLGTFDLNQVEAMKIAGRRANLIGKPIVFDPVGVAASRERRRLANDLLNHVQVSIIKGNKAEIATLADFTSNSISSCGVDSGGDMENPAELVQRLARKERCVVAMTGKVDYVSDGKRTHKLENGVEKLAKFTGSGCMTGTSIGCFASLIDQEINDSSKCGLLNLVPLWGYNELTIATVIGINVFNIAAELVDAEESKNEGLETYGPNKLRMKLIDKLHNATMSGIWDEIEVKYKAVYQDAK